MDALLVVLRGFGLGPTPDDDLETFKLELLVADRDHVERRLERVSKQAKSGDPRLRAEVDELQRILAHVDAGGVLADYSGELPGELEPLTTKPLIAIVNGPGGIDLQLEAELAELPDEEAAEFRGGGTSALEDVAARLASALDLITFFTAGEQETRAWTLRRGRRRSTRPRRSIPTSRAGSSVARSSTGATWSSSARTPRWRGAGSSGWRGRRTSSPTGTSERPFQRLTRRAVSGLAPSFV